MQGNLASDMLSTIIMWTAPIAMIVLVVFLIKDIKGVVTGETNIGRVLVKVICIFLLIGIMFAAESFETFGEMFKNFFDGIVTEDRLPDVDGGR